MRWRFCQPIETRLDERALRTEPARHPWPLGDALLDKRNASYGDSLCHNWGTLTEP